MQVDVLAFGPHPDDVELFPGGTRKKKPAEAKKAPKLLGALPRRCLGLGDGRLTVDWSSKLAVVQVIRELRPRLVFTNYWENNHPDHAVSGPLIAEAAYLAGLTQLDAKGEPHRPHRVIYSFVPHRVAPSFIVDVSDYYQKKLCAIQAHRSQFHDPTSQEPETTISHPAFLARIEGIHRYFGSLIDVEFGEAFFVREALKVDDPMALFDKPYTRFA